MDETVTMGVGAGLAQGLVGYLITIVVALATAGMIALVVKGLGAMRKTTPAPAPVAGTVVAVSQTVDDAEIARRVAVVAAAVATVAGNTRIVHIGEAALPGVWRTTGRELLHRSHIPRR
jgi:hypothetical protein